MFDLVRLARFLLKPSGRLVFFLPTVTDEYAEVDVQEVLCEGMEVIANSVQDFGSWGRRVSRTNGGSRRLKEAEPPYIALISSLPSKRSRRKSMRHHSVRTRRGIQQRRHTHRRIETFEKNTLRGSGQMKQCRHRRRHLTLKMGCRPKHGRRSKGESSFNCKHMDRLKDMTSRREKWDDGPQFVL